MYRSRGRPRRPITDGLVIEKEYGARKNDTHTHMPICPTCSIPKDKPNGPKRVKLHMLYRNLASDKFPRYVPKYLECDECGGIFPPRVKEVLTWS